MTDRLIARSEYRRSEIARLANESGFEGLNEDEGRDLEEKSIQSHGMDGLGKAQCDLTEHRFDGMGQSLLNVR